MSLDTRIRLANGARSRLLTPLAQTLDTVQITLEAGKGAAFMANVTDVATQWLHVFIVEGSKWEICDIYQDATVTGDNFYIDRKTIGANNFAFSTAATIFCGLPAEWFAEVNNELDFHYGLIVAASQPKSSRTKVGTNFVFSGGTASMYPVINTNQEYNDTGLTVSGFSVGGLTEGKKIRITCGIEWPVNGVGFRGIKLVDQNYNAIAVDVRQATTDAIATYSHVDTGILKIPAGVTTITAYLMHGSSSQIGAVAGSSSFFTVETW